MNGFRVGNLFEGNNVYTQTELDESVLAELNRMLSGETNNCERRVEITLSNITLTYSDQFGSARTAATITRIREIE